MPFVEGGIVVDAEPQQQAAPTMAQGGFVQGGIEVDPTPEDSYNKVLQFQAAQTDYTPSKQEFLDYLKVSKTKPLLGEKPLETIGTAAVQTAKDIATMPYKLGEAIGQYIEPPEGVMPTDVAAATGAEIAMQSRLKAESMARGAYDVALSNLEKLTGKLRSDDDRYEAFLATSEIKRQLARANAPEEQRVPAAQEFLQAYNIPQEAISQPGLEVGGFLADPSSIAFAAGGRAIGALAQRAAPLIPRVGAAFQRGGEAVSRFGGLPERGAAALTSAVTGSPAMGQAVQEAIAKGTTGVALGEAAGLPITATMNVPGLGTASRIIGGTKAAGATMETLGEAGAISGGQTLTPIQRGLLGAGERIAAAEGASASARAFGTALARSGLEAPIKTAASILIPAAGAAAGGGLLAGLTGEEGEAVAAAVGSGLAFGGIDAGFRLAKAASSDALNGNRVRRTAVEDLNTRPTEVQFTYIDPTTGAEQLSTIKDSEARAKLYAGLNNKQLTKALSEVAGAEAGGAEVIFHGNGDAIPASLQGVDYAGVAIGPNNIKSGKPTILINVDRAKPETLPHEILHARITNDVVSRLGSQVIETSTQSPEFQQQFTDFSNRYADKLQASGAPVVADRIRTELRDAFDPTQQRAQRIESLKRMTDEFAAYYTQELLKGKDPKTLLPGRIPSFFELAFNNAKEAVSERFTRQALQNGFDPVARTFYDANGKRIKIDWMEDAIKNLINPKEGFEPTEQKVDTRKMTQAQQNALVLARGYSDLFMTGPDGSIIRPLSRAELAAKTADVANRTMQVIETVPQNERTSVSGLDAKGNPIIEGRLSLVEADAVSKSGIFSSSTSRYIVDIATAIRDGTLMEGRYWKVYGPTGKSGVFGESEKLFLPYGISINSKGGVNVKAVDWGKVQARMYKALTKPAYKNLFGNYDQAMSTLKDVYLKNIAEQNAAPSAEALGGGLEGAKKRNFFNEVMGAVPKKGDVMINLPTAGYEAGRKGGSVYQDLRIERIQNANLTGNNIPWSGDMGEQSSYRRTQLNFQPAENIGETQVSTDQNGGYRILSKNGKFRLYGPDGSTAGIFDTEGQAKLKAEKDYATQTRLQPEVRQQQYPARDEGRQAAEASGRNRAIDSTQGREEGRQELGAVRQAGNVRFMPMSDLERSDLDLRISTRNPSAKRATENPLTEQLSIDLESIMKTPGALPEIINTVGKYPGIKFERSGSVNRANDFIRFVANNLIYLHDNVPSDIRQRSKLWYDGARKLTEDWSKRFDTTREGVAGVIASLSPQKDWYQNVTLAERVFEVVKNRQDEAFTGPIEQWARTKMTSGQSPKRLVQDEVINGMAGKKFSQLSDYEKAVFVRAFDEVNNTRTYPIVSPEGQMLDIARKADGTPATYAWGDFNSIAKAVKIAGSPNKKTVSESLGFEHKVRSFYDNILLPNNPENGDVTIDTHAVAAALMLPLAGSDVPVAHNFGQGVPGSSVYGTSGTYGIYADAYRLAAQERGILPREMQSITWEAIRGLFTPEFKTTQNKKLVENLWKEYKSGKVTLDETRQRIVDTAGGIRNPSWYGPGGGAVAENAPAAQPQKLPSAGDMGRPGANAGGGSAVPGGSAQEVGAQRFMPAGDMASGRSVKDHREAMDLFEKGYRLYGALYDGMEDPVRLKKATEIERFDPENLWAVPPRRVAAAIAIRNMPADLMPTPDSAMPGAYSFQGGYRAIPGKTKGSLRLYGPAGSLIGIASSLDEAQRILRRKTK